MGGWKELLVVSLVWATALNRLDDMRAANSALRSEEKELSRASIRSQRGEGRTYCSAHFPPTRELLCSEPTAELRGPPLTQRSVIAKLVCCASYRPSALEPFYEFQLSRANPSRNNTLIVYFISLTSFHPFQSLFRNQVAHCDRSSTPLY